MKLLPCFDATVLISKHRSQVKDKSVFLFIVYYDRRFDRKRSVSETTLSEKDVNLYSFVDFDKKHFLKFIKKTLEDKLSDCDRKN